MGSVGLEKKDLHLPQSGGIAMGSSKGSRSHLETSLALSPLEQQVPDGN